MKLNIITVIIINVLCDADCVKILGIFPLPFKSHYILGRTLMRGLAEKGHDITMISPFGEKNPPKNGTYRDVVLTDFTKIRDEENVNFFEAQDTNVIMNEFYMTTLANEVTEKILSHPKIQELLKSDQEFDVVVLEQFLNDALKAFAFHYKVPLVLFVTFGSNSGINPLVGNPAPPSYVPELMLNLDLKNFVDRLKNTLSNVLLELNRQLLFFPAQNKIMKKYFPEAPDLEVLNYNASLVLLNSHVSTNLAVPRVPSMVDIGGFHLTPPKRLPKDLQEYLDNAKDGVIYVSMGTVLQSVNLPVEKREALLKTFSKLKQKVLWKWESDVLPGQLNNVKLGKWLPQQDILAHPNVKAFITHGGLLSLIESVYHGVPVLVIPIFGDQRVNAAEAVRNGFGLSICYKKLTEEKLSESIAEVLNNPRYHENMEKRSRIMQDRQVKPMDDADYWIQYVVRHQGATHLRVPGLDLVWYQYLCLDVAAFVVTILLLVLYLFYIIIIIIKEVFRKLSQKNKKKIKVN